MTPLFAGLVGAAWGSFLNVVIDRLPQGQSLFKPPSHCSACGRHLLPWELLPVLGYLWLRGRCRTCRAPIPRRLLAMELASGLLLAFLSWRYPSLPAFIIVALYTSLFLVLAVIDLEQGIIPDRLTYPAILASLVLAPFWNSLGLPRSFLGHASPHWLLLGSGAAGVGAALFFSVPILIRPGAMGWGDVKLAGLIGLAVGYPAALAAVLVSLFSGGLVAGMLLLLRIKGRKEAMPFGPFLSLGAWVGLLWGQPLVAWYLSPL